MFKRHSKSDLIINRREILTIVFVIVNTFTWYFVAFRLFRSMLNSGGLMPWQNMIIWSVHFGAIIGAALIGATLSKGLISRTNLISLWICLGIISSFAPTVVKTDCSIHMLVNSFLFGISFGLGLPTCMGILTNSTTIKNRGRSGGFTWFAIAIGCSILGTISMFIESLVGQSIVFFVWRVIALVIFVLFKPKNALTKVKKYPSYPSILRNRRFLLYFIPWIMFCVINCLILPIIPPSILYVSTLAEFALTSLFAIIGGVLSDSVGRKPVIIIGFVMLGTGYAALGVRGGLVAYYLYSIMNGVAWGMFGTVFVMILWGDLSDNMVPEKYYAIGGLPYPLSGFLGELFAPYITEAIPTSAAFSFASFFLFLAVVPLLYAPETLPEREIRRRELRRYVEKAKKLRKLNRERTEQA